MKPIPPPLLNSIAALSLLLCTASAALWLYAGWNSFLRISNPSSHEARVVAMEDGRAGYFAVDGTHLPSGITYQHSFRSARWEMQPRTEEQNGAILGYWIPIWWLIVLFAIAPMPHLLRLTRRGYRRIRVAFHKQSPEGVCPTCGYDLRATPHRCPECGTIPASTENLSSNPLKSSLNAPHI